MSELDEIEDLLKKGEKEKAFEFCIFIILFVFTLSINLFEPITITITINRLILILTEVATPGMVLFSLDFTKIEIKSLKGGSSVSGLSWS